MLAVSAYKQLRASTEARLVIGPTWTPAGLALAPIVAKDAGVVMTSPSLGLAAFNESGANLFNTWPHDEVGTRALARYAREKGWVRAAVFASEQPWEEAQGNAFGDEFRKLGGVVTVKVETVADATNLKAEALKVSSSKPEVVFLANTNGLGIAARELRQLGYANPFLAVLLDETRLRDAQGALDGAVTARYPESSAEFRRRFEARFGERPGITADTAYDTVMLYAKAIEDTGTFDAQAIAQTLLRTKLSGASGDILFDERGGIIRDPIFFGASGLELKKVS